MSFDKEKEKLQDFMLLIKCIQFIFLAVFFYGTALLSYELLQLIPSLPISPWSIGCTIFGGEGIIASIFIIRSTESKIEGINK